VSEIDHIPLGSGMTEFVKDLGPYRAAMQHYAIPFTFADIDEATGFVPLRVLAEGEWHLYSWVEVSEAFDATDSFGNPINSAELTGPSGYVASGIEFGQYDLSVVPDPVDNLVPPAHASVPPGQKSDVHLAGGGPGGAQLVLDLTNGNDTPISKGSTGRAIAHLMIGLVVAPS
jgi:hypothetical protein